jgi:hypothetical protein
LLDKLKVRQFQVADTLRHLFLIVKPVVRWKYVFARGFKHFLKKPIL